MSHTALRRVMIRMLHDPTLVTAVYADAAGALAALDLTTTERTWLTDRPRAAWATDRERPARLLAALAEEYPATVVLAPAHAARFLGSADFHAAIQQRGSLALAFGDHLGRAPTAIARTLAVLERGIAAVRRADPRPPASPPGFLRLAPHARVACVPRGALALLETVRAGGAPGGDLGPDDEAVLMAGASGTAVTLELLEPALAALLARAEDGCHRDDLLAVVRSHGADPGEEAEIVDRLVADGILR